MKRIINLVLTFIFVVTLLMPNLASIAYAVGPDVVANMTAANYQPTGTFTDSTNATTGSRIQIYLEISNRTTGVDATNLRVSVSLPGSSTTQVVQANVSGGNFSPNSTDSTTINITNNIGKLVYVQGSTTLTWTSGSGPTYSGNVMPDDLTTSGFDFAPPLQPGTAFSMQLSFLADVVQVSGGDSSSGTQPAQGSTGGGPAQAPVCNDTKPGKVTLNSAKKVTPTSVKLSWTKATNTQNYAIRFGTQTKTYQYGVTKTGNTEEFTVSSLDPKTKYFFAVLPTSGCMPGEWSNEVSNTLSIAAQGAQSNNLDGSLLNTLGSSSESGQLNSEATSSSLESSPSASPASQISPAPKAQTGVNWRTLLILSGLSVLAAGAIAYYRSLQKKV